jgi:hypothetical protein
MTPPTLGNFLYRLVTNARHALFNQGELAQLTYGAFDVVAGSVQSNQSESIEISFPVGYRPDKTAILSTRTYSKSELLGRYQFLAFHQMPVNGMGQLVTIVEALLGDVLRSVVVRYPHKLGAKRTLPLQAVLEAQTLEEVHLKATDSLLNDLSYKSPAEFAAALETLLSVNLLECPAFHKYIELKATRDIHVHNRGVVNDTYLKKAGSHARAARDMFLPVDIPYFLESYEACLQVTEWLERELDQHWHSSERESAQTPSTEAHDLLLPTGPTDAVPPGVEQQVLPAVAEAAAIESNRPTKTRRAKRRTTPRSG